MYDKHAEGVAQVFFSSAEEADLAIQSMNGRLFFNKRIMSVDTWDGKTKYKSTETAEEEAERLRNWDKFLAQEEEEEKEKELKAANAAVTDNTESNQDSNDVSNADNAPELSNQNSAAEEVWEKEAESVQEKPNEQKEEEGEEKKDSTEEQE